MPKGDVLVVGNGPAGMAAAAACCDAGLDVTVLGVDHEREWPNMYGVWEDELAGLELGDDVLAARWPQVTVQLGEPAPRQLPRAYGLLDNRRLRAELLRRVERAGGRVCTGEALGVEHHAGGSTLETAEGVRHEARLVIDATGHRPALAVSEARSGSCGCGPGRCRRVRPGGRAPACQTAYGVLGYFPRPPVEPGSMVLMDYRDSGGGPADPTFLYAMDLGGGRFFVEETSLARRSPLDFDVLETRLRRRLAANGATVEETLAIERCRFPMGQPLPSRRQLVVGYGAAAGMVHPATGYQVGAALQRAPRLASALTEALGDRDASHTSLAAAGWSAVWPDDLVRQRMLHQLGLETLLRLDACQLRAFFGAFFDLPLERWRGYLSGAGSAGAVATTMLALFARAPWRLRLPLARACLEHAVGMLRR